MPVKKESKIDKVIPVNVRKDMKLQEKRIRALALEVNDKHPEFDYYIEIYNNDNVMRPPDTVGINIMYPNAEAATHWMVKEYPIKVTDKQIDGFLKDMVKELKKKIPNFKESKDGNSKRNNIQ